MAESKEMELLKKLQEKDATERRNSVANQKNLASTNFEKEDEGNVLKWLLDIEEDMQTIEHLLSGDVPKRNERGDEYWEKCPEDERIMSERGVRELLKIIRGYLTKNIFLSNFSEEEIRIRCKQFATRLNNFFHNNYEILGWDTIDKMKHYEMILGWLVDLVESAYNRALNGFTLKQIGTKTSIIQNIDENKNPLYPGLNKQKRKLTDPSTWFG